MKRPRWKAGVQDMGTVNVVAAAIEDGGKVLATQRSSRPGSERADGFWELPGGKVEPGESPQQALAREIREELDIEVEIGRVVSEIEYDYPDFHLSMLVFACRQTGGELRLLEHRNARWVGAADIDDLDWLPADAGVVEDLKREGLAR